MSVQPPEGPPPNPAPAPTPIQAETSATPDVTPATPKKRSPWLNSRTIMGAIVGLGWLVVGCCASVSYVMAPNTFVWNTIACCLPGPATAMFFIAGIPNMNPRVGRIMVIIAWVLVAIGVATLIVGAVSATGGMLGVPAPFSDPRYK